MSYQDTGLIFAGDIYIAEIENDKPGPLTGPINVPSFEITPPSSETINRLSRKPGDYGQALDVVNIPGDPAQISIGFDSLPGKLLAEALGGTRADHSVAADSVSGETVTLLLDQWVELDQQNLSESTIQVVDADDSSSLQVGTDVEVNAHAGLIKALKSAAAVEVEVDYDYLAESGDVIHGGTQIQKPRYIRLEGKNLATGQRSRVIVYHSQLSASEAMDLMAQEFATGTLSGNLRTPPGKDAPYEVVMLDPD